MSRLNPLGMTVFKLAAALIVLALAGCTLNIKETPQPSPTAEAVLPTQTAAPSVTPSPTATTLSPTPTITPIPASPTTAPTITPTPGATNTPVLVPQTPVTPPPKPADAIICATCGDLRFRESPGLGGKVIDNLDANTPLTVIGRTRDDKWLQVVLPDGRTGWVSAGYLAINIDLSLVDVTGAVVEAPVAMGPGGVAVISGITSHAREIWEVGQAKGNRANVFSKVGDSITSPPSFLAQLIDVYNLGDYGYLRPALTFFYGPTARGTNPFATQSFAALPGWGTDSLLTAGLSEHAECRPNEIPLVCEYRMTRPAVAIIMLGTNDVFRNPVNVFQANLQRIVDISIDMGVIPVLMTIPPMKYNPENDAKVNDINQVIVATAQANDIPLVNYWLAMQSADNLGLSADGVHPSVPPDNLNAHFDDEHLKYGYTVRNLVTLQVLYELWRQVLYDAPTGYPSPVPGEEVVTLPTSNPATYACPGASPLMLTIGGRGQVTPGLPNKVRTSPSRSGAEVGTIPGEAIFDVIGGPQCADGWSWWQIDYDGMVGWTAGGPAGDPWVRPYGS